MKPWFNDQVFKNRANVDNENAITDSELTEAEAAINQSGNSDVDVNVAVDIDTMPIALAILCQALIKKEITNEEFELATNKLIDLTEKYRDIKKVNQSIGRYSNDNIWRRRRW